MTLRFGALAFVSSASACSNLLISKGATTDESTIIAYSADSGNVMGDISYWPAADHGPDDLREIYSWDTAVHLGAIPQPSHTYNVIGNTNEFQLSIFETTFGGLEDLSGVGGRAVCNKIYGCIDYGQLIWVTLQRAKNAREAITTIDVLMQEYGYASEGESFSIADTEEVWHMELIGKGNHSQGAVWVAQKVPEGYVGAHANQARIRTFDWSDNETSMYSKDVVLFAKSLGLYDGADADFSFSDVYDPVSFAGARFCEARVYSFFQAVADPSVEMDKYLTYVQGYDLSNRMPLFIKTKETLTVNDTMWHMRNHYENTWFDSRTDVGSEQWNDPHRLGEGLIWSTKDGKEYVNERPIGTHYAGWNVIGHQRGKEKYSVLWFGADDSTFSLHAPFYGIASQVPPAWSGGNCTNRMKCKEALGLPGTMRGFTMDSQHWVQNLISNYVYSRYDQVAPVVQSKLVKVEGDLFASVTAMDEKLRSMDAHEAAKAASKFTYDSADGLHQMWKSYFGELFATYVDGYVATYDPSELSTGTKKTAIGFNDKWKQRIVADAGEKYHVPSSLDASKKNAAIDKLTLRGLGGSGARSEL